MRFILSIAIASFILCADSYAMKVAANGCVMQKQVNLSVNYNMNGANFTQVKTKYDEKINAVQEFAKKQGVKVFELQSMNYNINPMNYDMLDSGVQLSGSATYKMDDEAAAFKLAEFLNAQKMNASINVSAYQNGNCNSQAVE